MLPDLRVVTIAVISTFLFAVSVGFYTSSRLMSERKPRTGFAGRDRRSSAQSHCAELAGAGAAAVEPARSRFRRHRESAAQSGSRGARRAGKCGAESRSCATARDDPEQPRRTARRRQRRRSKRPKSKRPRSKQRKSKPRRSRRRKLKHPSSNCPRSKYPRYCRQRSKCRRSRTWLRRL